MFRIFLAMKDQIRVWILAHFIMNQAGQVEVLHYDWLELSNMQTFVILAYLFRRYIFRSGFNIEIIV